MTNVDSYIYMATCLLLRHWERVVKFGLGTAVLVLTKKNKDSPNKSIHIWSIENQKHHYNKIGFMWQ